MSHLLRAPLRPTGGVVAGLAGKLSEKGVLQLLLDVRLVREVLAGARPLAAGAGKQGRVALRACGESLIEGEGDKGGDKGEQLHGV